PRAVLPQRLVELLLRADVDAVYADDAIAALEARARGGADRGEAVDGDAAPVRRGVEAEPRTRHATLHAPRRDQLVLHGQEALERDEEVRVRHLAEAQRADADHFAALVHERAAAPRGGRRRHDERAIEHVLPRRGEAADGRHVPGHVHEVVVLVGAHRAGERALTHVARLAERG